MRKWSVRPGVVAMAAAFCFLGLMAEGQVASPPSNPQLPAPAPLAGVRYNYPWEVYGGLAYSHFDAGPNLTQGANLGGFDVRAIRELTRRFGVGVNVRGYYGTSGAAPNCGSCSGTGPNAGPITGPFVSEHLFLAGPEYRVAANEHAALLLHVFAGGAYGNFTSALGGLPPSEFGFFANQLTFGMAYGGSIDLNRSPRLVFRIAPDGTLTTYGNGTEEHFGISVGLVYRLGKQFRR
jgi:hypothetical protein